MKLQLVRMPDERDGTRRSRVHFITINEVIVERLIENSVAFINENRWDYDTRVMTRIAVFEDALKVKHTKTRGI